MKEQCEVSFDEESGELVVHTPGGQYEIDCESLDRSFAKVAGRKVVEEVDTGRHDLLTLAAVYGVLRAARK